MTERIFKYVLHSQREAYEELGWIISELGPPHCDYSVLAEWVGDSDPQIPAPHTDSGRKASADRQDMERAE